MKTKRIFFFLATVLFGINGFAQITYTYDDTGNRDSRFVVLKSAELPQDSAVASQIPVISEEETIAEFKNPALEEMFGELQVKLYPNPTSGSVYIELNRLPDGEKPVFEIWSPTGRLIGKSKITGQVTRINLWGKPDGIYFIKTKMGDNPVTWRIIKK